MITLLFLLFLAPQPASAFSVGDFIERQIITKNENGTKEEKSDRQELVSFNPLKQQFLSVLTIHKPDAPQKTWKFLFYLAELLAEQQKTHDLLDHCNEKGGVLEDVTVGSRILHTCAITTNLDDEKYEIWYSPEVLLNKVMERRWTPNNRFWQETRVVNFQ